MDLTLSEQLSKLKEILSLTRLTSFWESLPIIDETREANVVEILENDLPGLRHLRMSIEREIETIENHLALEARNEPVKSIQTNSLYYFALWNEILCAPRPISCLGKMFTFPDSKASQTPSGKSKDQTTNKVKVDIVSDNGKCWTRVNTTKVSRLEAEFRHIETYSYESSEEELEDDIYASGQKEETNRRSLSLDEYLENTIFETGRQLSLAADHFSTQNGYRPRIHMRLSRLDENAEAGTDKRIVHTIKKLRDMGVVLLLGPNEVGPPTASGPLPVYHLPNRFNLDLSLLVALVTDITHASLPATVEEADARFQPQTDRSWKRQREKNPGITEDAVEHCRALAEQTRDEMERGLIARIYARVQNYEGDTTFWTTVEARDRFLAIVEKIGGPEEQRRASAMFSGSEDATKDFWRGSRIDPDQQPRILPIRLFSSSLPEAGTEGEASTFHQKLVITCQSILERPPRPDTSNGDQDKKMPAPTRFAARLSAHTVQSLLWGAEEGMVTLTSNKTSVRLVLREMRGFALPSLDQPGPLFAPFAIWVMEPRSLSQGMRNDIDVDS